MISDPVLCRLSLKETSEDERALTQSIDRSFFNHMTKVAMLMDKTIKEFFTEFL